MTIDEGQRLRLVGRLRDVLGTDETDTLMSYLPAAGASELVTTEVFNAGVAELRTEIADLRTELKTETADLRTELKTEMADLRTELKTEMADLRTDLRTELHVSLRETTNTILIGLGGLMVAWGAAIVAVIALH